MNEQFWCKNTFVVKRKRMQKRSRVINKLVFLKVVIFLICLWGNSPCFSFDRPGSVASESFPSRMSMLELSLRGDLGFPGLRRLWRTDCALPTHSCKSEFSWHQKKKPHKDPVGQKKFNIVLWKAVKKNLVAGWVKQKPNSTPLQPN